MPKAVRLAMACTGDGPIVTTALGAESFKYMELNV